MAGLNENIMIRLMADTSNYTTRMQAASAQATKLSTALEKPMTTSERVGAGFTKAGLAIGSMSAAIGVAAVTTFAQFDAAMSTVQANTGASASELDKLRQAAIDAGANTVYNAQEAAGAINELGKAGMSTTDILAGGLSGALDLAASDGMQVSEAAELMSSAMSQFNLTGADAGRVADALAAGAGKAQGSARDLGYALQQSGMVANSFGIGMKETVGTLTAFANAGMVGSDAGTSLKTMLLALANPSEKAKNLMQELGINAYDAQGDFVGLANLAGQLQTRMGGLSQEQRNQALATIFGSDAIRAANVLYKEGAKGIDQWTKAVGESGYAAAQAAAKNDNLKGDLENLSGSFESMLITIGSGANGPLRSLVQALDTLVDGFSSLPAPVQQGVVVFGLLAGATAGLHKQFGALGSSSGTFAQRLGLLIDPVQRFQAAAPLFSQAAEQIGAAFGSPTRQLEVFGQTVSRTQGVAQGLSTAGQGLVSLMGGPLGIAVTAAAGTLMIFAHNAQTAKEETEAWKQALQSDAGTASMISDVLSDIGDFTFGIDDARSKTMSYKDALASVGITTQDYTNAVMGNEKAQQAYAAALEKAYRNGKISSNTQAELQAVLDENVSKIGEANDKAQLQSQIQQEVANANKNAAQAGGENATAMQQMSDASGQAADAASILAANFGATTDGINEQAAALGEVTDALSTYYGFSTSASDALISMHDAFDKATKAAQENGETLDLNTEQGRANQSALNDIADSALKAAEAQARNGASMDEINGTLNTARDNYIKAAQSMGLLPEQAEAAANAAGLSAAEFERLGKSIGLVPDSKIVNVNADTGAAEGQLQALGVTVETLPDGTVKIGGDNTDAIAAIAAVNGLPVDSKTGTVTLDSTQYYVALALANGATIDQKTGYLVGDGSDLLAKVAEANGWKIDKKTGVISGDNGPFKASAKAVENTKIAGKTVKVDADASGFWGTVNGILGKVFSVNVRANESKAHGGLIGYASGGLMGRDGIPRYASGGPSGLLGGIGSKVSDSNLILASRGEYMMKARAVDHYGVGFMDSVNAMRYTPGDVKVLPAPVMDATPNTAIVQSNEAVVAELRAFREELGPTIAAYAPTLGERDFDRRVRKAIR